MTPDEIIIRALNGIKNYNLKKGNKSHVGIGNIRRDGDRIRFTISKITDSQQGGSLLEFDDTYYELPITAIKIVGGKTKVATAMGQSDVKWIQKEVR